MKLDGSGTKLWDRTLGGSGGHLNDLQQTCDGGYILGKFQVPIAAATKRSLLKAVLITG